MLWIGGGLNTYSLSSSDEARQVADYIWNNFLDGVDFVIAQGEPQYYIVLATRLHEHGQGGGKKIYLATAPQCPFPDENLKDALSTNLFDYVWVEYFNNPRCDFNTNNPTSFMNSWRQWASSLSSSNIFIGLPASLDAAAEGYIQRQEMISQAIPFAKQFPNYGGVMLWNMYYDGLEGYSNGIKSSV